MPLYPDIDAAGDLTRALRAEFDRQGVRLDVRPYPDPPNGDRSARVGNDDRRADLLLDPWRRRFVVKLTAGGTGMGYGHAPDLAAAAGAMHLWHSGARAAEVAAAWPFLGSVAPAEARERGDRVEACTSAGRRSGPTAGTAPRSSPPRIRAGTSWLRRTGAGTTRPTRRAASRWCRPS